MWLGKIIGGVIGYLAGGDSLIGMALGVFIGHALDTGLRRSSRDVTVKINGLQGDDALQWAFFRSTFLVMGQLAKADGPVSEAEIKSAESIIDKMGLNRHQRQEAIRLFTQGKQTTFNIIEPLSQLRESMGRQYRTGKLFVEIQLQAAYADGELHPEEKSILARVCQQLKVSTAEYEELHQKVVDEMAGVTTSRAESAGLTNAYHLLGVKVDDTDAVIKKAYRKLISRYHPDKLMASGQPEHQMEEAKERAQEIQAAYDLVRSNRKQRVFKPS